MEAQDLQKWMAAPEKDEKMEDLYSARGIICESLAFMLGQKYSENGQLEKESKPVFVLFLKILREKWVVSKFGRSIDQNELLAIQTDVDQFFYNLLNSNDFWFR